jgi:phosphoglycerate dehydrogenase-like enzyme/glyoxylase-like metal-dependent hydrolase (beta-lactamase superfamily II)
MRTRYFLPGLVLLAALLTTHAAVPQDLPKMKFNEVKEIAPGVYFRYSSISATDDKIPFGGSNNIWVVCEDYVVVFDANFPKEAKDVIEAIKTTTNKPIRYVLDSHHHGDHSYGNAVFAKEGATIVAQTHCARLLKINGPKEFEDAGKPPTGRKDIRESYLKQPSLVFDDKLVLEDSKQRVEFYFLGHAHTAGDAFLYLPKHKILCTGDACVNGAFNFMGHSDSASWIRVLERAEQLEVKVVLPGHGAPAGKELLAKQKKYFVELRAQIRKGIDAGKHFEAISKSIDMSWYKEWTGTTPAAANIKHVYGELTGQVQPPDLVEDFGIYEGPSPTKETPGWTKPKRIIVPNLMPARLAELKVVAPDVFFVPVKTAEEAASETGDADAVLGYCTPDIVKAGKKLRWIQVGHAGVEKDLFPELVKSDIVLTNLQRLHGPNVADQAFALLLALTRGLHKAMHPEPGKLGNPPPSDPIKHWNYLKKDVDAKELHGKTMLIVGLGGVGTQIAKRADAFGMRVMAIDPNDKIVKPAFVFSLEHPDKLMQLLPLADVVVLACPLTDQTRGMFGKMQFAAMKPTAYVINIARGGVVKTADLIDALERKAIAGAGLDVTDPEPLPNDHPLWKLRNVVISPHIGGQSAGAMDRQWRLFRENVRRFVAGERLLCVVDKEKGY